MQSSICFGQNEEVNAKLDSLYSELDLLFENEDDITKLLKIADSLLAPAKAKYSSVSARVGYISKILSAGRDFGVNQFGALSGASYLHKSGAFVDVLQYFNSAEAPALYMTNFSLGYYWRPHLKWDVNLSHDFYVFNRMEDEPRFERSFRATTIHHRRFWDIGLDYSYLYGNEQAHRLVGNGNLNLKKYDVLGFDRISFYPGVGFQFGSNNVYFLRQPEPPGRQLFEVVSSGQYPQLTREQFFTASMLLRNENYIALNTLLRRNGFAPAQIEQLFDDLNNRMFGSEVVFGMMNYAFNFPFSMTNGNWSVLLNYTLNIPVALKGETYEYPVNGFYSISLNYIISWK